MKTRILIALVLFAGAFAIPGISFAQNLVDDADRLRLSACTIGISTDCDQSGLFHDAISEPFSQSDSVAIGTVIQKESVGKNSIAYSISVDFYLKNYQPFDLLTVTLNDAPKEVQAFPEVWYYNFPLFNEGDLVFVYLAKNGGSYELLPESFALDKQEGRGPPPDIHLTKSPSEGTFLQGEKILVSGEVRKMELVKAAKNGERLDVELTLHRPYDERDVIFSDLIDIDADGHYNYHLDTSNIRPGEYHLKVKYGPSSRSTDISIDFNSKYWSPLKQFKSGVPFVEIQCKDNLTLIQKHDGTPACMQESSVPKLIERGWAISNGNHLSFDTITPESPLAKFYVQPQITSIVLKQDSTVRVHLFSYIKEDDSDKWDHVFDRIFDEVPKNYKIGIVENTPNNINEFATLGKTNLPSGMQAELLREDGYFVVYLTLNKLSEPGNYDLAVVFIDKGKVIQKPLFVIAVIADTAPTQDNIVKLHHSKYPWGIELENMSEQEYWTREDSRLPWPPSPILEITQDNIHHDVNELIDAMWSEDAKYIQSEYDKKTLRVENDADLNVDPKKIRDWLKVVHDEQFKENLDDSFTGYIRYDGKIYSLGFIIAD